MIQQIAKQPQIPPIPVYASLYVVTLLHLLLRGRISFSILETGLGPVTCFDQQDISKHNQKLDKHLSIELPSFTGFGTQIVKKPKIADCLT